MCFKAVYIRKARIYSECELENKMRWGGPMPVDIQQCLYQNEQGDSRHVRQGVPRGVLHQPDFLIPSNGSTLPLI